MTLIKKDKVIMTVGACNCSGCSGLATDVSLMRMLQCYPMTVASCVVSEGPGGFRKMQATGIDMFRDQLEAILANVRPDAVKVGFLPSVRHMELLTSMLDIYEHGPVVFAPGLFYSSGQETLHTDWIDHPDTLVNFMTNVELFVPNKPELSLLVDPLVNNGIVNKDDNSDSDFDRLYEIVFRMHVAHMYFGARNVMLVGGLDEEIPFTDILLLGDDVQDTDADDDAADNDVADTDSYPDTPDDAEDRTEVNTRLNIHVMQGGRIDTPNTRGLCDVYSTALAALFAMNVNLPEAAVLAKRFTSMLLDSGKDWRLYGEGDGPAFAVLKVPESADNDSSTGSGNARPGILDMGFPGIFN